MKTVKIKCKQVIHFEQEIEITEDQFKILSKIKTDTVSERNNLNAYSVLTGVIDFFDILNSDAEFIDFELEKI